MLADEFSGYPRTDPSGFPPVGVKLAGLDEDDQDVYDLTYKGKQVRASFAKGTYALLKATQSATGKFLCGLPGCVVNGGVIALNPSGTEDYATEGCGPYKNVTKPHIDHFNPDWKDRLKKIEQKGLSMENFQIAVDAAYNAPGLRILHKKCNLSRPK